MAINNKTNYKNIDNN
uniref:Uncharacterized protein n=1 Tax=Amphimedon queenslandica TaxID=400682 RepID=A0A1X7VF62_AMPQE